MRPERREEATIKLARWLLSWSDVGIVYAAVVSLFSTAGEKVQKQHKSLTIASDVATDDRRGLS